MASSCPPREVANPKWIEEAGSNKTFRSVWNRLGITGSGPGQKLLDGVIPVLPLPEAPTNEYLRLRSRTLTLPIPTTGVGFVLGSRFMPTFALIADREEAYVHEVKFAIYDRTFADGQFSLNISTPINPYLMEDGASPFSPIQAIAGFDGTAFSPSEPGAESIATIFNNPVLTLPQGNIDAALVGGYTQVLPFVSTTLGPAINMGYVIDAPTTVDAAGLAETRVPANIRFDPPWRVRPQASLMLQVWVRNQFFGGGTLLRIPYDVPFTFTQPANTTPTVIVEVTWSEGTPTGLIG